MPLEQMIRIYFLQQWYSLSDPAMKDALYDIESMRWFTNIELGEEPVPNETRILNFRCNEKTRLCIQARFFLWLSLRCFLLFLA